MILLEQGARQVVETCGGTRAGERVVIVAAPGLAPEVTVALQTAVHAVGAKAASAIVTDYDHLDEATRAELMSADLVVALTDTSIAHTDIGRAAAAAGARVLAMTRADSATLTRGAIEADFPSIAPTCQELANWMSRAVRVTIATAAGTRLEASLEGRLGHAGTGMALFPHTMMGCPDIEAYVAPVESSVNGGVVIVDASSTHFGLVDEPITVAIVDGRAVSITGGRHAAMLREQLAATGDLASCVFAEIGIGLNPQARMVGNIIEDEAVYGSGHVALGTNETFGGANCAPLHCDLVHWYPTVHLDGEPVMCEGVLVGDYADVFSRVG